MNERGFFTVVGLCLLLILAISITGVQEFEGNYASGIDSVQVEKELQNFAESALLMHIETSRDSFEFSSEKLGVVNVTCYENPDVRFRRFRREYVKSSKYNDIPEKDENGDDWLKDATVYMSVASCDSGYVDGKIYRRVMAYVIDDDPKTKEDESFTIHFMNDL